jgi:hypothetical protein
MTTDEELAAYKRAAERAEAKLHELGWVSWPISFTTEDGFPAFGVTYVRKEELLEEAK